MDLQRHCFTHPAHLHSSGGGLLSGTRIKAAIGHPMVAGVGLWALAHLLSNGRLGDLLLFGAFFVWATIDFRAARQRDRATGTRSSQLPICTAPPTQ